MLFQQKILNWALFRQWTSLSIKYVNLGDIYSFSFPLSVYKINCLSWSISIFFRIRSKISIKFILLLKNDLQI